MIHLFVQHIGNCASFSNRQLHSSRHTFAGGFGDRRDCAHRIQSGC